jgi:hypothetical protein
MAEDGGFKQYRMLVHLGHKMMTSLLFEADFEFTYEFLDKLDKHMAKHSPVIS